MSATALARHPQIAAWVEVLQESRIDGMTPERWAQLRAAFDADLARGDAVVDAACALAATAKATVGARPMLTGDPSLLIAAVHTYEREGGACPAN